MHPDATRPDYRTIDAHLLGVALGCGLFGFAAGVFFTRTDYLVMAVCLAIAVAFWVSARYFLRHPAGS